MPQRPPIPHPQVPSVRQVSPLLPQSTHAPPLMPHAAADGRTWQLVPLRHPLHTGPLLEPGRLLLSGAEELEPALELSPVETPDAEDPGLEAEDPALLPEATALLAPVTALLPWLWLDEDATPALLDVLPAPGASRGIQRPMQVPAAPPNGWLTSQWCRNPSQSASSLQGILGVGQAAPHTKRITTPTPPRLAHVTLLLSHQPRRRASLRPLPCRPTQSCASPANSCRVRGCCGGGGGWCGGAWWPAGF